MVIVRREKSSPRSLETIFGIRTRLLMNHPIQSVPTVFSSQRVEDVVRRLHVANRFAALSGPHMAVVLEMERDFVFGIMREDRAKECMDLYDFIFRKIDFPIDQPTAQQSGLHQDGQETRL